MVKKIIVFGASGFVGQNVVEKLSKEGHEITATDIRPMSISPPGIIFKSIDILDEHHINWVMEGHDIIVHHAVSNLRTSFKNPLRNVRINIEGTVQILEAARKHDIEKIIYSSASSVMVFLSIFL